MAPTLNLSDAGLTVSGALGLRNLVLAEAENEPFLSLPALDVELADSYPLKKDLHIAAVRLQEPQVQVARAGDGTLNLQRAFAVEASSAAEAEGAADPEAADSWRIRLDALDLEAARIRIEDDAAAAPFRAQLIPLSLKLRDVSTEQDAAGTATLSGALASGGEMAIASESVLSPLNVSVDVELGPVDIAEFAPYYQDLPAVDVAGDQEPFLRWESLSADGVAFQLSPMSVDVSSVVLTTPIVEFVQHPEEGTLERIAVEAQVAETSVEEAETEAMALRIQEFVLKAADLTFRDGSVSAPAAHVLSEFGGRVEDISLSSTTPARFEFAGLLGEQGKLNIEGQATPALDLTLKLALNGMEMPPLAPYTGKFVGWGIKQGKLSLGLNYEISMRKLESTNNVVLDAFELGERIESPDATKLPLKLGLKLLRDHKGLIDLDLPVDGDLDDPEFRVHKVLAKVFTNLVTKAVASPFSLLESVIDAAEPLHSVDFTPGGRT